MKYDEFLKVCKFFHGESDLPEYLDDSVVLFWLAEAAAADAIVSESEDQITSGYNAIGEPGAATKLPPVLLATLFSYFSKGAAVSPANLIKPFERDFLPRYIASTSM